MARIVVLLSIHALLHAFGAANEIQTLNIKKPSASYDHTGLQQDSGTISYGYRVIENADFPARYDYPCEGSKAEWGCVFSQRGTDQARARCKQDQRCKAFVVMPHVKKPGYSIIVFKSASRQPVAHPGTSIFIKIEEPSTTTEPVGKQPCQTADMLTETIDPKFLEWRRSRESNFSSFTKISGIKFTDKEWLEFLETAPLGKIPTSDSGGVKRRSFIPTGTGCDGGEVLVTLGNTIEATFHAKRACGVFDLAHLAVFYVDRLLGMYVFPPCAVRTLSETEMALAGFPKDIGGDYYDKFKPYKEKDGTGDTLTGLVCPKLTTFQTNRLTIPKLNGLAEGVVPVSDKQKNHVEWVLLAFLASIPVEPGMPDHKLHFLSKDIERWHLPFLDHVMIHLDGNNAFQSSPTSTISQLLYNCNFPRRIYERLLGMKQSPCSLGQRVEKFIESSYSAAPKLLEIFGSAPEKENEESQVRFGMGIGDRIDDNVNLLLNTITACEEKHGSDRIFY